MDTRMKDLEALRKVRKELVEIDRLSDEIAELETVVYNVVTEKPNVMGKYSQEPTNHESRLKEEYLARAHRKKRTVATVLALLVTLVTVAIYAYSTYLLWNEREIIKTFSSVIYFWMGHLVVGLAVTFLPAFLSLAVGTGDKA